MFKQKNGITLVALIITVIVLLILAGVVVNLSMGENGIIGKAQNSGNKYKQAAENEQIELAKIESFINGIRNIDKSELAKILKEIIEEEHIDTNPVGTVISYIGSDLPEGYLACDGTKYAATDYPKLFDKLKDLNHTGWKAADWTTEFTVPDLRGEFLRGNGTATRNTGGGDNIGNHQDPTYLNNVYTDDVGNICFYTTNNNSRPNQGLRNVDSWKTYSGNPWLIWHGSGGSNTGAHSSSHISVRPTNTSVLYCIKY